MRTYEELKSLAPQLGSELRNPEWIHRLVEHDQPNVWSLEELGPLLDCSNDEIAVLVLGLGLEFLHLHAAFACTTAVRPYQMSVRVNKDDFEGPPGILPDVRLFINPAVEFQRPFRCVPSHTEWGRTVQEWFDGLPLELTENLEVLDYPAEFIVEGLAAGNDWCFEDTWIEYREPPCEWIVLAQP